VSLSGVFHSDSARKILFPQYMEGNPREDALRNPQIKQCERLSKHKHDTPNTQTHDHSPSWLGTTNSGVN
jgi:hypothetical protein